MRNKLYNFDHLSMGSWNSLTSIVVSETSCVVRKDCKKAENFRGLNGG